MSANLANQTNTDVTTNINSAKKILILSVDFSTLTTFLNGGSNGNLLNSALHTDNKIIAFVGDNSRYAGKTVINNYLSASSSYNGSLSFTSGLSLLKTTVIMPNTYSTSTMYENSATAVPYSMVKDGDKYGVWLYAKNFLKYYNSTGKTYFTSYGTAPAMVLCNTSTKTGYSTQTSSGTGTPRMIAGFEKMRLSLIDESVQLQVGNEVVYTAFNLESVDNSVLVFPNPTFDNVKVSWQDNSFNLFIFNELGSEILSMKNCSKVININISNIPNGLYFVKLTNKNNQTITKKLIINK